MVRRFSTLTRTIAVLAAFCLLALTGVVPTSAAASASMPMPAACDHCPVAPDRCCVDGCLRLCALAVLPEAPPAPGAVARADRGGQSLAPDFRAGKRQGPEPPPPRVRVA